MPKYSFLSVVTAPMPKAEHDFLTALMLFAFYKQNPLEKFEAFTNLSPRIILIPERVSHVAVTAGNLRST
jgi:hypothetical protein